MISEDANHRQGPEQIGVTETIPTTRTKLMNFSALWAWLISSTVMAALSYQLFGKDFRGYFAAAKVLLAHGNPYDYNQLAPVLMSVTGQMGNNPYYYPPWFAWFFTPFTLLPYEIARMIWMAINLAVWIYSLWQLGKFMDWPKAGWKRWLLFLLFTYLFAWITWRYEQMGIILFGLLVAGLIALRKGEWIWAGIWIALLLVKPNVMAIPMAALSIWLLKKKKWQPVAVMAIVTTGLFIPSTLATPDWYKPLLQPGVGNGLTTKLDGPNNIVAIRINSTLLDFLGWLHINGAARSILYGFAIAAGLLVLFMVVWKSRSLLQVMAVALLVGYGITPYALQYDFPPLALVLFWGMALTFPEKKNKLRWMAILVCIFIFSIPLWERPISEAYLLILALGGLLLIAANRKNARQTSPELQ